MRPDHPGGVDLYVGGVEHAVLHLLYARFWHKVLFDLGHLSSKEPYARLFNQGYVLAAAYKDQREIYVDAFSVEERDGRYFFEGEPVTREMGKMGKSLKNGVSPDVMYDAVRRRHAAPVPDGHRPDGRVTPVGDPRRDRHVPVPAAAVAQHRRRADRRVHRRRRAARRRHDTRLMHRTIDVVRTEMDALRFNTAIAKLIELNNAVTKLDATPREVAEAMVLMVAPLAPHLAEELWRKLGHDDTITYVDFPVADPQYLVDETIEYPVQINGKVRSHVVVATDADQATVEAAALADDKVIANLDGGDAQEGDRRSPAGWSTSSCEDSPLRIRGTLRDTAAGP